MKKRNALDEWRRVRAGLKRWRRSVQRRSNRSHEYEVPEVKVSAPSDLSFQNNFSETVEFLDQFRRAALLRKEKWVRLHIDLEPVKTISIPVAIILAAEFHRWKLIKKTNIRAMRPNRWTPHVRNILSDLGVFSLLDMKPMHAEIESHLTLTRLTSGDGVDNRKVNQLQARFASDLENFTTNPQMYAGLSEAAENAVIHAYEDEAHPTFPYAGKRWWGASCLNIETMSLRFFIFDQGVGIPATLPTKDAWELIRSLATTLTGGAIPNDSFMLRAALEVGRTRTGLSHRGLGFKTMTDVVTNTDNSYLRILSGKGEIVYNGSGTIETRNHDRHIGGTLIEWSMPADAFNIAD